MSSVKEAYVGAQIHDGRKLHENSALAIGDDGQPHIFPRSQLPADCLTRDLRGGLVTPGFVDLQVNGGGGVMFNDAQTVDVLRTIAEAHATIGTTALLPTLITDTPARTRTAIDAVEQAIAEKVDGIVGIHLEGPHLSVARKGAHDAQLIRKMTSEDLDMVLDAAERLPNVMMTVAPENTSFAQMQKMADAGVIVSLGHTDAGFNTCMGAFDAGARCVTHLFNAMSQIGNREPGLVGATLLRDDIYAGLIADGIHVNPASIRLALAARNNCERLFLVTDAMAPAGSQIDSFLINGRRVLRKDGRLTLQDGTLAGADLELAQALSVMTNSVGDDVSNTIRRATATPAGLLREARDLGRITRASRSVLHIQEGLSATTHLRLDQGVATEASVVPDSTCAG